ncbi:MAG: hypothetical protein QOH12_1991 [Solirubrobacteraceae bacterium]|nr:hypothetical protein [Solirubrobacteraceae bacterium]
MAQRQINIRMPDSDIDVLEAAAFLEREAMPDLVRGFLQDRINTLRNNAQIQDLLRARAERDGTKSGVVTSIKSKRRAPRSDES